MYEIHVYKYTQRLKIEKPTPYTPNTSCQSSLFQTSEVILFDAVSRGHFNMTKKKLLSVMTLNVDMICKIRPLHCRIVFMAYQSNETTCT